MISILIPSRGRPERLADCCKSFLENCMDHSRVQFVVRIDADDPSMHDYFTISKTLPNFVLQVGERGEGYARNDKYIEECASLAKGKILMQLVDTAKMETKHWDAVLAEKQSAYPNNGYFVMFPKVNGYRFSFPAISRKVYEACGCFCLGENPSVDRCWEAFVRHLDIEIPSGITIHHEELRNTKNQDQTASDSLAFYTGLNNDWEKRSGQFNEIGERYSKIVLEKMKRES